MKMSLLKEKFIFDYFFNEKNEKLKLVLDLFFNHQHSTITETQVNNVMNEIIRHTEKLKVLPYQV